MSEQTAARRFTMDEAKAREWLAKVAAATEYALNGYEGEDPAPGEDLPEIPPDWKPREYEQESTVYALVQCAGMAGVIAGPDGAEVEFSYSDDCDGGYYRFHVSLGRRIYTELASYSEEMRKLGDPDVTGTEAALSILDEAVYKANNALDDLDQYIASRQDTTLAGGHTANGEPLPAS